MDTTKSTLCALALVACALIGSAAQAQAAYPEANIEVNVGVGQKVALWVQSNYNVLCRSLGQPTFELDSTPSLGEIAPDRRQAPISLCGRSAFRANSRAACQVPAAIV